MPLARLSFVNLLIMTALRDVDQDDHDVSRKAAAEYSKLCAGKFASPLDTTPDLIARFLLMWMSIISDRDEDWLQSILLLLELTVKVPIASLTMSERFITIDRSAFGTENGGSVDQWISGGGRSHGGAEARQATARESDGRHKGQLPYFVRCPGFAPGLLLCGR